MFRAAVFHVKHCRLFCGGVHGFRRDTACRVRQFPQQRERKLVTPFRGALSSLSLLLCKTRRTVANVPPERFQNQGVTNGTQGRSGLVRSALEKLSLFSPTFSVRQEHGAGSFAVCGRRLRGHVPSKNTSPAALSWSSLTCSTAPVLFVSARCFFCLRVILQHVM